jgi:glutaminase
MGSIVHDLIAAVHADCLEDRSGEVLREIPVLEHVDPDAFGIALATADGHVYEVGDAQQPFYLQSISKPFTYGIALSDHGTDAVDAKIDVEPSGEVYNEISLDPVTHRPRNPMINAGALVAANLVAGETPEEQVERIQRIYSAYAGRELELDEEMFAAQVEVGHRNRAIGHMLRAFEILEGDPNIAHEVYLQACSILVTCRDLALMGATWANGGVNPLTGESVLSSELTERVLSVMSTCGMYDAAGSWFAEVGLAAKSGVGGGIVAVLPGQLSIAAFSPRLDRHGNSVRAFKACRRLSHDLELHELHVARAAHSAIRDAYDIVDFPSAIQRPQADRHVLEEHGHKARVYEVHGDLLFAGVESVVREVTDALEGLDLMVLDVRRVGEVADISRRLLSELRAYVENQGREGALVDPDGWLARLAPSDNGPRVFRSVAAAAVWCEDWLIERYGEHRPAEEQFPFRDHPLFAHASADVVDELGQRLKSRSYADGDLIVREGDTEAGAFFVMRGRVRSSLTTADGIRRNLATLSPGSCFGEAYVVTGGGHPLTMHAEGPVELYELTRDEFSRIRDDNPELWSAILYMFVFAIRDDLDRALRSAAAGRLALH